MTLIRHPESAAALWRAYRRKRSIENRNAIVVHYWPLALKIGRSLWNRGPNNAVQDDYDSAAADGLIEAVERFDSGNGASFETYANHIVRGRVRDYFRNTDPMSQRMREIFADVQKGKPVKAYTARCATAAHNIAHPASIDQARDTTHSHQFKNDSTKDLYHQNEARQNNPYESDFESRDSIDGILQSLDKRARIICKMYISGLEMGEIGAALGLCESRISQIWKQSIGLLRQRFGVAMDN